jgi:1-deoxy-D-xylulose-5-phosphate synthase
MQNNTILSSLSTPSDLRKLGVEQLSQLANEVRQELIAITSETGGHLGASLGAVELTIALHYIFDTPHDTLVWDIGHQAYAHKLLTGRKDQMRTLRKPGGLSGFLKRSESEYDAFGAGHSSTSISAALGMAVAAGFKNQSKHIIAVIGDSAIGAGMAYEAMNHAGDRLSRLIVILNDNEMSIAPAVGAMSKYLCRLTTSGAYLNLRSLTKGFLHRMPNPIESLAKKFKKYIKDLATNGNFFEEMGFHYIGPVDGHDVEQLVHILSQVKDTDKIDSPILIHVKTKKGHGFNSPEKSNEGYHAVQKFDLTTKIQFKAANANVSYTKVFANTLTDIAKYDPAVVAITAGMPSGTGLSLFEKHFPNRMFDVGIAEQHAVTFAAGLATNGMKPYVALYSTFLQRGYDQVVHDVALQNLPVRFAVDRAGYVGADGPTHAGSFDIAFLANLPNFVVMAPSDEVELARMILTANQINDRPSAFRFPRADGGSTALPDIYALEPMEIGKGRIIREGSEVAILSLGTRLTAALAAADALEAKYGAKVTVADARFAKPLDEELIRTLAQNHKVLLTIEEGAIGGFGAHVSNFLLTQGLLDKGQLKFRSLFMPDNFLDQDSPDAMYNKAGLGSAGIMKSVEELWSWQENSPRTRLSA